MDVLIPYMIVSREHECGAYWHTEDLETLMAGASQLVLRIPKDSYAVKLLRTCTDWYIPDETDCDCIESARVSKAVHRDRLLITGFGGGGAAKRLLTVAQCMMGSEGVFSGYVRDDAADARLWRL